MKTECRPIQRCVCGAFVAAILAAAPQLLGASAGPVEAQVRSITGHTVITTVGLFTAIETFMGAPNAREPREAFTVQYESRPSVRVTFDGDATVLHSKDSIVILPRSASGPAMRFTVAGRKPVEPGGRYTVVDVEAVGLAKYGSGRGLFEGPLASASGGPGVVCNGSECLAGGPGSTDCSVSCGNGCSVSCGSGYYACCNCLPTLSCNCCK